MDTITVVVVYAPTEMTSDSIKDSFYNHLPLSSRHHIVLGDLNAVSRSANLGTSGVMGPFGSGTPNDNTERLHLLCGNHGFTAVNCLIVSAIHRWASRS